MNPKFVLPKIGELPISTSIESICKFEKVSTSICETEKAGASVAADVVVAAIKEHKGDKPFALGLSTGRTPIGLYRELVNRFQAGEVSFKDVVVYSLDEFYPMQPNSPQSRNHRVYEDFLKYVDINPANVHFPDGTVSHDKINEYCRQYEKLVNGCVDLMIMGVGERGQVGFNEPGTAEDSVTHVVDLTESTIKDNSRLFNSIDEVPTQALSMGVKNILDAKKILVVASGANKADAVAKSINGEVTPIVPASFLQKKW